MSENQLAEFSPNSTNADPVMPGSVTASFLPVIYLALCPTRDELLKILKQLSKYAPRLTWRTSYDAKPEGDDDYAMDIGNENFISRIARVFDENYKAGTPIQVATPDFLLSIFGKEGDQSNYINQFYPKQPLEFRTAVYLACYSAINAAIANDWAVDSDLLNQAEKMIIAALKIRTAKQTAFDKDNTITVSFRSDIGVSVHVADKFTSLAGAMLVRGWLEAGSFGHFRNVNPLTVSVNVMGLADGEQRA